MFDSRGLESDARHLVLKTRIYYVFVTLIAMPCPLDQDYSVNILDLRLDSYMHIGN